jgi:hypothetical protein
MSTATPTPALRAPPRTAPGKRPSVAGYWLAGALGFLGLALAITWFGIAAVRAIGQPEDFARASIPGQVAAPVTEAGTQVIYFEGNDTPSWTELGLTVAAPGGANVPLQAYDGDLRYDVPGSSHLVATAVARFDASTTGKYLVTATGSEEPGAKLAIGEDINKDVAGTAAWAGLVVLLTAIAASAITFATYRRRSATA